MKAGVLPLEGVRKIEVRKGDLVFHPGTARLVRNQLYILTDKENPHNGSLVTKLKLYADKDVVVVVGTKQFSNFEVVKKDDTLCLQVTD